MISVFTPRCDTKDVARGTKKAASQQGAGAGLARTKGVALPGGAVPQPLPRAVAEALHLHISGAAHSARA